MTPRVLAATVTACLFLAPCPGVAQSDVTFKVPLNLTQVSPDIAKVAVWCYIVSPAITTNRDGRLSKQVDLPVAGGQLVTTATVVVAVSALEISLGKTADWGCTLTGFSTSLQRWDVFDQASTVPAFRLSPTPVGLKDSFNW